MPAKLPVPNWVLETTDVGSGFQTKMNDFAQTVKNAILAYNAQIDAYELASDFTSIATEQQAKDGVNDTLRMTPKKVHDAFKQYGWGVYGTSSNPGDANGLVNGVTYATGVNKPKDLNSTVITAKSLANVYGFQLGGRLATGLNLRFDENDVWSPWVSLYSQNNIVGSVSESGGMPTGAIFNKSVDANGVVKRNANGRMSIRHQLTLNFNAADNLRATWNYADFISTPTISISIVSLSSVGVSYRSVASLRAGTPSNLTAVIILYAQNGVSFAAGDTAVVDVIAEGEWY